MEKILPRKRPERFAKFSANKSSFYRELNQEVKVYLTEIKSDGSCNQAMVLKICFCVFLFIVAYYSYLSVTHSYLQWLLTCLAMGVASMLVGVNIAHDAIHQALFRRRWMNRLFGFSFDLIGISSFNWRIKHNLVHHRFPNVIGVDYDIEAAPLLRLSPTDKWQWFHKYQSFYAPLVYCVFSLHLVFFSDFALLKKWDTHTNDKHNFFQVCSAVVLPKFFYLFYILAIPIYLLPYAWWQIVIGFIIMHFGLSIVLALVLLPAHLFEQTSFKCPENGQIDEDWAVHQMATTLDFESQNSFVHFFLGGFNTNVVHHLFPHICHCHYKKLATIVAKKSKELGITYYDTTMPAAIASHFKSLKMLGQPL